ncbi:unnamed protein product [Choristocarpus tenellus]
MFFTPMHQCHNDPTACFFVDLRKMWFVMPSDITAENAPQPRDESVVVRQIPDGELLAVRAFPGFATGGEVTRQLYTLLGALTREATEPWDESSQSSLWQAQDPSGASYRIMQYNPPYTLPWLKRNEVAVQVIKSTKPVEQLAKLRDVNSTSLND